MILLVLAIVAIVGVYLASTYNFFAGSKQRIKASIQEIGNQLKRQADLIPNLEESAKGYIKHEEKVFTDLTDARKQVTAAANSGDLQKMADAGAKVAGLLPQLKIAVEDNPELKADNVVVKLMDELRDTSDKVMYARRVLIDLTADYNVKRVTFPSSIVAGLFHFEQLKGLDTPMDGDATTVSEEETKTPKVKLT